MSRVNARYDFEHSASGGGTWKVTSLTADERLNAPYEVVASLATEDVGADANVLLGADAVITVERGDQRRRFLGIVRRVEASAPTNVTGHARIHVAPALWAASRIVDTRIFQEMSAKDILESVLGDVLGKYGREADVSDLAREYPVREYCVQHRETTLAFVSRLMEEEGIGYRFDHEGDVERLVLSDSNDGFGALGTFPLIDRSGSIAEGEQPIVEFELQRGLTSTSAVVADYDWSRPAVAIGAEERSEDGKGRDREVYQHRAELTIGDYSGEAYGAEDSADQARLRREGQLASEIECAGVSRVVGFAPGATFELDGHLELPELNREYLITRVVHDSSPAGGDAGGDPYHNRFFCIPKDVAWRPPRVRPRPHVSSVQTAIVVGPSGEEIHTDEHGRIKVQFPWDRHGANDEQSSCWIRVRQPWAGPGWGHTFIPRIGMEVVVRFVDGDPDRPVVLGSVYNGNNRPPYPLPDEKTKSTIKSNSSLGGGGFNEIRFEDAAGSEEIFTHAQKDQNERAENDHTTDVGNDQKNVVGNDQTEDIGSNQTMTVDNNRTVHVKAAFDETIDSGETRKVSSGVDETITGGEKRDVTGGLTETITGDETRTIDGNLTETITGPDTQTISGNCDETISGTFTQNVAAGITATTPATFDINAAGGATITCTGPMTIMAPGGHKILAPGGQTTIDKGFIKIGGTDKHLFRYGIKFLLIKLGFYALRTRAGGLKVDILAGKGDQTGVVHETKEPIRDYSAPVTMYLTLGILLLRAATEVE